VDVQHEACDTVKFYRARISEEMLQAIRRKSHLILARVVEDALFSQLAWTSEQQPGRVSMSGTKQSDRVQNISLPARGFPRDPKYKLSVSIFGL
jgi:hypothetical protein